MDTVVLDPLVVVPAMAAVAERLGFGVTASVRYESPYLLARTLTTLDHFTGGRIAWNIVTSYQDDATWATGSCAATTSTRSTTAPAAAFDGAQCTSTRRSRHRCRPDRRRRRDPELPVLYVGGTRATGRLVVLTSRDDLAGRGALSASRVSERRSVAAGSRVSPRAVRRRGRSR
ncbi:LLM class flavin-dependent oxidoreductase [Agrococcus sediminis]